jgi:hypothetical protein
MSGVSSFVDHECIFFFANKVCALRKRSSEIGIVMRFELLLRAVRCAVLELFSVNLEDEVFLVVFSLWAGRNSDLEDGVFFGQR